MLLSGHNEKLVVEGCEREAKNRMTGSKDLSLGSLWIRIGRQSVGAGRVDWGELSHG